MGKGGQGTRRGREIYHQDTKGAKGAAVEFRQIPLVIRLLTP
jgi:hypothetical protein